MTPHAGNPEQLQALLDARDKAARDLEAAERAAGIWQQADSARDGPLIPYGVFDQTRPPPGSREAALENDLYWADQHDHARRAIRALYFSVPDAATRMRLISLDAELDESIRKCAEHRVRDARLEVAAWKEREASPPWILAGVLGCIAVLVGSSIGNVPGAIGGAVLGLFWGKGTIQQAAKDAKAAREIAESFLRDAESDLQELNEKSWHPAYFSECERRTGRPDEQFGNLSATERRLAMERKNA